MLKRHAARRLAGVPGTRLTSYDERKPWCDDPKWVAQQHDTRKGGALKGVIPSLETGGYFPCRKCEKCITFRRLRWRDRCQNELNQPVRSWFVTLTFSDVHLAGIRLAAHADIGRDFEKALEHAAYKHVQRYLKRVRKNGKTRFRYVAIFEYGALGGRGHYHLFIHERPGCKPVLKRTLNDEWRSFVDAVLVESDAPGVASYVCKYLTKSAVNRPRASVGYGGLQQSKSVASGPLRDGHLAKLTPATSTWSGTSLKD